MTQRLLLPEKILGPVVQPLAKWGPKPPLSTRPLPPSLSLLQPNLRRTSDSVTRLQNKTSHRVVTFALFLGKPLLPREPPQRFPAVWLFCHLLSIHNHFIQILCPSIDQELTPFKFSRPPVSRRRTSSSTTHPTSPDMALKRINKELTDLGRYVVPESHFCPPVHLLRRGCGSRRCRHSIAPHGGARPAGHLTATRKPTTIAGIKRTFTGSFCTVAVC
jgi:hypothetical protein